MMGKKIIKILHSKFLLNRTYVSEDLARGFVNINTLSMQAVKLAQMHLNTGLYIVSQE